MSTSNTSSRSAGAGLLAALVASLCCITPVFSLLAGIGGIAATFSWMEPFRPFLIVLTVGVLGFAWYQKLKPRTAEEIQCDCEEDQKPSFWQSKKFLSFVTAFAMLMLAFPSYAHVFYPESPNQSSSPTYLLAQDTSKVHKIVLDVKGMTCAGCESHIKYEVGKLAGIQSVDASYAEGNASIEFLSSKVERAEIVAAINKTGYTVIDKQSKKAAVNAPDHLSFYKVPLVCNAAPSIGCGSKAKPILQDFENDANVHEAWLNRKGTVIAVLWLENAEFRARRQVVNSVFTKHQVNASELLMNDYATNYDSFNQKEGWLRNSDVDQLSKEEAGIIAEQILQPIKKKTTLSTANESKLRNKVTDTFYEFFLSYKSIEELGDASAYKARLTEIIAYGENLLGEGNMPSLDELWMACSSASKNCSHSDCSSTCKLLKKS